MQKAQNKESNPHSDLELDFVEMVAIVAGTKSNKFFGGLLTLIARHHRLLTLIIAVGMFGYYCLVNKETQTNVLRHPIFFCLPLALNLLYVLYLQSGLFLYSRSRNGVTQSRYARFLIDSLFVTVYLFLEYYFASSNSSMIIFLYFFPLLLAGYYFSLRWVILIAVLSVVSYSIILGTLRENVSLSPHNIAGVLLFLVSPVILNITASYSKSYLRTLEDSKTEYLRYLRAYSSNKLSDTEFFSGLLDFLKSSLNAEFIILAQEVPGSEDIALFDPSQNVRNVRVNRSLNGLQQAFQLGNELSRTDTPWHPDYFGHRKNKLTYVCFLIPPGSESSPLLAVQLGRSSTLQFKDFELNPIRQLLEALRGIDKHREEAQLLAFVEDTSMHLAHSKSYDEFLKQFLELIAFISRSKFCSFWEFKQRSQSLHIKSAIGLSRQLVTEVPELDQQSCSFEALSKVRNGVILKDYRKESRFARKEIVEKYHPEFTSVLILPLVFGEVRVGVLHFWGSDIYELKRIENLLNRMSSHFASLILGFRLKDPIARTAMDDYWEYLAKKPFIKKSEYNRIHIGISNETRGRRTGVRILVRNDFELHNISRETLHEDVRLQFESPLSIGVKQYFERTVRVLKTIVRNEAGEILESSHDAPLQSEAGRNEFETRVQIIGRSFVKVEREFEYFLPDTCHDTILTNRISLAPCYEVSWDSGIDCRCTPISHIVTTSDGENQSPWSLKFPTGSVVLPYQGVYLTWAINRR